MASKASWLHKPVRAVLLDITGVLYDSGAGDGKAIAGSIDAVNKLQNSSLKIRFCSNESQNVPLHLVQKLQRLGFNLTADQVFTPAPAVLKILKERNLQPHLLVHPSKVKGTKRRKIVVSGVDFSIGAHLEAQPVFSELDQANPTCVVMGDCAEYFSFENVNRAFQMLMQMQNPILFSMGVGKYYKEDGALQLDVGAYLKALEYACDIRAEIVGKPSLGYFQAVLDSCGVSADEAIMIGDDIATDIHGAQEAGIRAVLVRTGKFRPNWENHPTIRPDGIVDNLAEAVDKLLS